jgi:hypothetical protein
VSGTAAAVLPPLEEQAGITPVGTGGSEEQGGGSSGGDQGGSTGNG